MTTNPMEQDKALIAALEEAWFGEAAARIAELSVMVAGMQGPLLTFLDAAAGEGFVLDGVDAADLYHMVAALGGNNG